MLEGVGVVLSLRIEDGHSFRECFVGHMMVADNKVYALFLCIGNLLDGFDAAIEDNDQFHLRFLCVIYSLLAHTIALLVAVGDLVVDVGIELLQELIDECHGCTAVHIIVAINENTLFAPHCVIQPVDSNIHVLHQERVD